MSDDFHYDKLVLLNNVFNNTLHQDSSYITPDTIKTKLYPHQNTLIQGMRQYREKMTRGFLVGDQAINGKVGIVADPPGSGKTLSMIAYLASHLSISTKMTSELTAHSSAYFFSHRLHSISETNWAHLIVVPHRLFGQWKQEFDQHTSLPYVSIETKRIMKGDAISKLILQHRIVITTDKCYKHVQEYVNTYQIQWDQIMIDEASAIFFHSSDPPLRFQFLWLITNNWIPLIIKTPTINKSNLFFLRDRITIHPDLENWLLEDITVHYEGQLVSSAFMKEYISFHHPERGRMILRNRTEDITKSMNLPVPQYHNLQCKPNMTLNSLISFYLARQRDPTVRSKNIPHLFQSLGIEFQSIEEYRSRQPIEKHHLIQRMINDRECVICLEQCEYPTMVQCCYHLFCGKCLLKNALINMKCPTCRSGMDVQRIHCLETLPSEDRMLAKNKMEVCLDILRENKEGRFIIYSPFTNIYYELMERFEQIGIKAERIENNLFSLIKTVRNFQKGITRLLFLSNVDAIRGLSLTSTTHLIFYHELPSYESKQVLLHSSQRMGRTLPLQILHLHSEIQV
uniref:RING-type domain-containing protein n=1 Tax=viral metagenome TaxID=1070528 RepID=A0A6C0KVQ9_9ZZZZ